MTNNNDKSQEFKAKLTKIRFNNGDFTIAIMEQTDDTTKLKRNKRDELVVVGNLPSLVKETEYLIKGIPETNANFGWQYKVVFMRTEKPTDFESSQKFLSEVIGDDRANILLGQYPNIIDKVMKNDLSDIDLNRTKGIKGATFEKIKNKIIENFCLIDLLDLFNGLISMSTIKKMFDIYKSVDVILAKLKKNPYESLCRLSRIGFKTADEILLKLEKNINIGDGKTFEFATDLLTSSDRMKACIRYILKENETSGNTKIEINEIRKKAFELTPQCIGHFVSVFKDNEEFHIDKQTKTVSFKKTYEEEKHIANTLKEMLQIPHKWNINTELFRIDGGITLTDEQIVPLYNLCKHNVSILTAPAGSGKSQSVKNIITMLKQNDKTFALCTPTGKSSEVLQQYTGEETKTIHRVLEFNPAKEPQWGRNKDRKLDVDVVIIDEFGMVDISLMVKLLEAIDISRTKILFVFDSYQLASVSYGNLAHDLLTSKMIPTARLTKIFRYAEGGLMKIVTKVRNGEKFLDNDFNEVKIFGSKKDFIFAEKQQEEIQGQVIKIYKKLLQDGHSLDDIMVLTPQNKGDYGTKAVNKYIQELVQQGKGDKFLSKGFTKFYVGDKVLQVVNDYKAKNPLGEEVSVFNGNTGIVVDIDKASKEMIVDFGNKQIVYDESKLNDVELGYCISIHKSQGDSAKFVITITPKAHTFMLNSNLLYVAWTRAKNRVFALGNIITINRAIKKKENLQRNTYLQGFLKETA